MSGQKYAGVDVNGVLFDLEGRRQAVEVVSGKRIPRTCFGDKKYVLRAYNVTPEQYDEAMALYFEDDSFFNNHTSLMPGAANGIWKLYAQDSRLRPSRRVTV